MKLLATVPTVYYVDYHYIRDKIEIIFGNEKLKIFFGGGDGIKIYADTEDRDEFMRLKEIFRKEVLFSTQIYYWKDRE